MIYGVPISVHKGFMMVYLFLGEDSTAKDQKIKDLKKKYLKSEGSENFDFAILHGKKLSAEELKRS